MQKGCERYEEWKAERALKTKIQEKKKERKKRKISKKTDEEDMEDVDEFGKTIRKCRKKEVKKEKKKKPRQRVRKIYKHIPESELILGCIKPSIEVREYFLNPRHISCMGLTVPPTEAPPITRVADRRKKPRYITTFKKWSCFKKISEESDLDSPRESICSFHSEICLANVKLTPKDHKEIKKSQEKRYEEVE
ncbi:uncharacterized protein LOC102681279 [Apis dorsata]|uniref:uncharacterized protein LOC102681279 n=1 Tax=Apis dorsata TaxID=7462 RepID=UPI0003DF6C7C|nr:uncharacterized protein LOC102681279 [Apis dorsata]